MIDPWVRLARATQSEPSGRSRVPIAPSISQIRSGVSRNDMRRLGPIFGETFGMCHGKGDQVFRLKLAQSTAQTCFFPKLADAIDTRGLRHHHRGYRVPGMPLEFARGTMVARDNEDVRLKRADTW